MVLIKKLLKNRVVLGYFCGHFDLHSNGHCRWLHHATRIAIKSLFNIRKKIEFLELVSLTTHFSTLHFSLATATGYFSTPPHRSFSPWQPFSSATFLLGNRLWSLPFRATPCRPPWSRWWPVRARWWKWSTTACCGTNWPFWAKVSCTTCVCALKERVVGFLLVAVAQTGLSGQLYRVEQAFVRWKSGLKRVCVFVVVKTAVVMGFLLVAVARIGLSVVCVSSWAAVH